MRASISEIIDQERAWKAGELAQLNSEEGGSAIEGPLRPVVVKVGELATYITYIALITGRVTNALIRPSSRK